MANLRSDDSGSSPQRRGRPVLADGEHRRTLSISLAPDVYDAVQRSSATAGVPTSKYVENILRRAHNLPRIGEAAEVADAVASYFRDREAQIVSTPVPNSYMQKLTMISYDGLIGAIRVYDDELAFQWNVFWDGTPTFTSPEYRGNPTAERLIEWALQRHRELRSSHPAPTTSP